MSETNQTVVAELEMEIRKMRMALEEIGYAGCRVRRNLKSNSKVLVVTTANNESFFIYDQWQITDVETARKALGLAVE